MNSDKVDGPVIAQRLAELADLGRQAVGVDGDLDVTFHGDSASYVMTLKRPHPKSAGDNLCATLKLLEADAPIPPLHYEVVHALNRLDGILTREERRLDRSRLP